MIHEYITPTKYTKDTEIIRADGPLIEDGAGIVVLQRFRRLQSFVI